MYYTTKGAKVQERFETEHRAISKSAVELNNQRTAQSGGSDYGFLAYIAAYRISACTFPKAGAGLIGLFYFDCKRGNGEGSLRGDNPEGRGFCIAKDESAAYRRGKYALQRTPLIRSPSDGGRLIASPWW